MIIHVKVPKLGLTMEEATVAGWSVAVGDHVVEGQELVEIETEKAVNAVPSPVTGQLLEIHAHADETLEVGARLCTIDTDC